MAPLSQPNTYRSIWSEYSAAGVTTALIEIAVRVPLGFITHFIGTADFHMNYCEFNTALIAPLEAGFIALNHMKGILTPNSKVPEFYSFFQGAETDDDSSSCTSNQSDSSLLSVHTQNSET